MAEGGVDFEEIALENKEETDQDLESAWEDLTLNPTQIETPFTDYNETSSLEDPDFTHPIDVWPDEEEIYGGLEIEKRYNELIKDVDPLHETELTRQVNLMELRQLLSESNVNDFYSVIKKEMK